MRSKTLKNVLNISGVGIIGMCLIVSIGLSVVCPNFLKLSNIMIGIWQVVHMAIVVFAMTFVISLGGIDLSMGSMMRISGMVLATMTLGDYNIHLAIGVVILLGTFINLVNDLLAAESRIAYFIATLGTTSVLQGLIYVYTRETPLYGFKYPEIRSVGQGYIGVAPFPIVLTLIIPPACYYLFYKTRFGRYTVSISSNGDAVKLVGINTDKIKILVFMLGGVLYTVVGVILASKGETATPEASNVYKIDTTAATVTGGTNMSGGKGNTVGTAFGVILVATIKDGLSLLNANTFWYQAVIDIFVLLAVALGGYTSNRAVRNGWWSGEGGVY